MTETNLSGKTPDIAEDNILKLKQIFPDVFTEDKVDFEKLQQVLGNYTEDSNERYNFTWNGKGRALRLSQTPSQGTLRPCKEESKDWDTTQNLYIEGDNLEVLKLLQKSYYGKVKMIYIDPPYNTGGDFVYPDDFKDSIQNYLEITGQVDSESKKISTNSESSGRYHTNWLNMMYPRLRLARNLLTDDGVIFISIDDNEVHTLHKLCDEVFGEENFVNIVSVNMKNAAGASGGGEDKRLKKNCEFTLIFAKNYDNMPLFKSAFEYTEIYEVVEQYRVDGKNWHYTSVLVDEGEKIYVGSTTDGDGNEIKVFKRPNVVIKSVRQIMTDEGISEKEVYYRYGNKIFEAKDAQSSIRERIIKARTQFSLNDDVLSIEYVPKTGRNKGVVYEQFYKGEKCRLFAWLNDITESINGVLYKKDKQGTYWDFTASINNLTKEGGVAFPNGKKPISLIKRIAQMVTDESDIVLDFFSGSATSAHGVMELNAEDGGYRKFICVQLPEPCDESSDAFKAGYNNICEIGKERIRRAGDKIKQEKGLESQNLDIGFKVLKLDTSNIRKWQPDYENLEQTLHDYIDNYVDGRTELDVVYEIMLKYGLDLTYPVDEFTVAQKKVYSIGFGMLMICLDDEITTEVAKGILTQVKELAPESTRVVFKDNGFKSDSNKTNIKEILKCGGIEEFITL